MNMRNENHENQSTPKIFESRHKKKHMASTISSRTIPPLPQAERGFPCNVLTSVDGTLIYGSGSVIALRPADERPLTVNHHSVKVTAASISPNGVWVATGDAKGTVRIWSSRGERIQKYEYRPIASGIRGICWSPDNRRIAVCGGDKGGEGICFSYDTGSAVGSAFSGHSKPITCIAYRPVAPFRIMTGGEDTSVIFHEGPPFKFMKSVQNSHTNFVNAVAFGVDGSRAFSCASDGIVAIYTGDTGDLLSVLDPKLPCSIWGLAPASQGTVYAACGDRKIRAFSVDPCAVLSETVVGEGELKDTPLGITSDAKRNAIHTVSLDGTIRTFSIDENSSLALNQTVHGSCGGITSIVPFKDSLLFSSTDGSVWSLARPFLTSEPVAVKLKKPVNTAAGLLVDVLDVIGVGAQNDSELINIKTGDVKKIPVPSGTTKLVACKPVGYAVGSRSTSFARVHQPYSSVLVDEGIDVFSVSENGETIVLVPTKDRSKSIALQQEPRELMINNRARVETEFRIADIVNVAVSPTGKYIAAASGAQELHVYKQTAADKYEVVPATVKCWTYHKGRIGAMVWIDERLLLTGGLDKSIYVWDVEQAIGGPAATLKDMHKEGVSALIGFRTEGTVTIVSGGNEGSVKITVVTVKV